MIYGASELERDVEMRPLSIKSRFQLLTELVKVQDAPRSDTHDTACQRLRPP